MRVAPLFILAAALTFAASAQAQTATSGQTAPAAATTAAATPAPKPAKPKAKTRIEITKRSPLDAGTTVKPGSKSYLDYALPAEYSFPTYGAGQSGIVPGRYPLPDRWYLPGY